MNRNWQRWIFASLAKYFDDNSGDYNLWIAGDQVNKDSWHLWCDFYLSGPRVIELSKNYFRIDCEISLICSEIPQESNAYELHVITGYFSELLVNCIPVYRYGIDTDSENDGTLLGNLQLNDSIDIQLFGTPSPGTKILQSTVRAPYRMFLEGEA